MRTNLHMKAKAIGATVGSQSFNDGSTRGARFECGKLVERYPGTRVRTP